MSTKSKNIMLITAIMMSITICTLALDFKIHSVKIIVFMKLCGVVSAAIDLSHCGTLRPTTISGVLIVSYMLDCVVDPLHALNY